MTHVIHARRIGRTLFYGLLLCSLFGLFIVTPAHAEVIKAKATWETGTIPETGTGGNALTSETRAIPEAGTGGQTLPELLQRLAEIKKKIEMLSTKGAMQSVTESNASRPSTDLPRPNLQEGRQTPEKPREACAKMIKFVRKGNQDKDEGGVFGLQRFLAQDPAIYPEGLVTGYFGHATQEAVKKFQEKNGIVKSGSPETTGFGAFGPKTMSVMNAQMAKRCSEHISKQEPTHTQNAYTLSDVKSVTSRAVDPIPLAIDDEYTLYTITLNDGVVHTVKKGFTPQSIFDAAVRATGYTGDIAALIAKAVTTVSGVTPRPDPSKPKPTMVHDNPNH